MDKFQKHIIEKLKKVTKLKEISLETPPCFDMGDYAFPCFILSKKLKKNPKQIAIELADNIKDDEIIHKVEANGPYINFFINKQSLAKDTLKKIFKEKDNYGKIKSKRQKIMVEFFHANTHKGVHIGHIRNISIGESLCRVLEFNNNKVYRINYFGDIGPHVAKCLWGYIHLKQKEPKDHKGIWLGKIYAMANKKSKQSKKVTDEINQINNKLYAKDKELTKIWKKTKQWCYDDFDEIYKEFGFKFDRLYPESECETPGKKVVQQLLKQGIAKKSEGAVIIDLEKYNLGVIVLLTKDGNALYSTKDLGMIMLKGKEYDVDKSIHVVGSEQELYFRQLFKIFELMKHNYAFKSLHLSYGLVMLPEGKMSSREGTMVLYEDLKQKLLSNAEKQIKKRYKKISKKELDKRKEKIALGALKFNMINREFRKNITFDWERALDFEGETGPYLQYTYARINSIIKKGKTTVTDKVDLSLLTESEENQLINMLNDFPTIIKTAGEQYRIHILPRYLLDLAQLFNQFYHAYPVLKADEDIKKARLLLINSVKQVLKSGLNLLGIDVLEIM